VESSYLELEFHRNVLDISLSSVPKYNTKTQIDEQLYRYRALLHSLKTNSGELLYPHSYIERVS
jgi:hypothetical protein